MKNKALFSTLLLTVALMVLASCDPTLSYEGGRKVKFTVSAQASPETKTAYYGTPSNGWQVISWKEGDKIRIYSPADGGVTGTTVPQTTVAPVFNLRYVYADYTVKNVGVSTDEHSSKGKLDNVDPNGLTWTGADGAIFYAAYPGDKVMIATNTDNQLRFAFKIDPSQSGDPDGIINMPMLAMEKVSNGEPVVLNFYPAFSAFEFNLTSAIDDNYTIDWVELSSTSEDATQREFPLAGGYCYYDLNKLPAQATERDYPHFLKNGAIQTDSDATATIHIDLNKTLSPTSPVKFTFFTLPYTHKGLVFYIHCSKTVNGAKEEKTRKLKLKYTDNTWVEFPAGHKTVIKGVAVDPDLWCFSAIILQKSLIWELEDESTASNLNPEASQFAVTGVQNMYQIHESADAYKQYNQRWILPTTSSTATVSFKIMSPRSIENDPTQVATYEVTPQGDTDYFEIAGNLSGDIAATGGATKVTFTVTPKASAIGTTKKVWFTTSVKAADGTVFNIDSETQLYDLRGYHYFMTQEQTANF